MVMARAKKLYVLIIKFNKLFSFFSSWCFLKEIDNMYSVFLSSYRNTRESLGELTRLRLVFPQHLSFSETSTRVSIKQLDYSLSISIA